MRKIKKFFYLLLIITCVFMLNGCKKENDKEDNNEVKKEVEDNKIEQEEETELEEVVPENQNLLTGLPNLSDEAIGKRPVAVMINNVPKALPQYGISEADLIFEIVVEGDQTRFMALYGDYTKVPKICSVRSCRKYFPIMSQGFDAVYVHWGMSKTILDEVNAMGLTRYDGMANTGGLYGRDQDRRNSGYSLEHTGYFDGTQLPETMVSRGERTELLESKTGTAFLFNGMSEQVKPTGDECTNVNIEFGAVSATLIYDAETNTYLKQINGKKQVDGVSGEQLEFTNVFVLETNIGIDPVNDVHKKFDWTGGKDSIGYYVSNGAMQKISWMKEDINGYLKFYDENGEELSINRGKSYIAINHIGQATFE